VSGPGWIVPDWPAPPRVAALATTRQGGVSAPPCHTFNLAAHVGDDPAAVAENRARLRAVAVLPTEPVWLRQVHGARIVRLPAGVATPEADGSWTDRPGVVCAVLTADCVPVLLCDRAGTRVAAVHAGWRGLAAGVLEAAVAALGGRAAGLIAWLGPAIGPAGFEVGPEVVRALGGSEAATPAWAWRAEGGRWRVDLWAVARARLAAAGVVHVSGGGLCTWSDPARFYSYRRDGSTGRMATLVWLRPDPS